MFLRQERPRVNFHQIACVCRKKDSAAHADAVTMGDVWLAPAIQAGLVQPIPDVQHSAWWVSIVSHTQAAAYL